MPRSTPPIRSSVECPAGSGWSETLAMVLQRHMPGGVGVGAPVGAVEAGELRDPPVELVADEGAVLHEVPGLPLDALVVVAMVARPCSAVRSPVTFIRSEPYLSLPSWSKVAKEVPAYAAS